ncbi:ATP-binding protein [Nannocystis sp. SCPEA4]|uniref:ATP-binding protein n=1 Tax=Nannocystis sp. SCPEA4 TaxID=2996787 RepID=UPI0022708982|nr:ATP-binding protein [Nannocystis sp. SCPEA4]
MSDGDTQRAARGEETAMFGERERAFASSSYARLLAASDALIFELDREGRFVAVNGAAAQALGYTQEQLLGARLPEFVHADERGAVEAGLSHMVEKPGEVVALRTRFVQREGRVLTLAWQAVLEVGASRACALASDVGGRELASEREHAAAARAIAESEARLGALCDHIPAIVYLKDEGGAYLFINRFFEALLGRRREEVLGRLDHEVLPTAAIEAFTRGETQVRQRGATVECEEVLHGLGDGARTFYSVRFPLRASDGKIAAICGVSTDISGRKSAEAQLVELNESLERRVAERTAAAEDASRAKSEFLARMSHELRTPLNAILGYSELLEDEMRERGTQTWLADLLRIRAAGKHLLSLINDILDISKIEAGKMLVHIEEFTVAGMIDEVVATSRPLIEKNRNTFRLEISPSVGSMRSDPLKIRQCLLNLLSNAGKFTNGGQVEFSVARQIVNGRAWILFRVSDTGIGIAQENIGQLFREFYQVDSSSTRRYGGTGLGLVITQRLCHMLGGDIRVSSRPGQGSQFTLELPAVHIEAGGSEVALELDVLSEKDVARARVAARELCQKLGARPLSLQKIATIISELARNMVLYAGGGKVVVGSVGAERKCVFIRAVDEGSGIADVDAILAGRKVSRNGRGLGLIGTKRLADGFRLHTGPTGTWIEAEVNL